MKKLLVAALAVAALLYSPKTSGNYYEPERCPKVCAFTMANNYYRFVRIANYSGQHVSCSVTASNGAYYHDIFVPSGSSSRPVRINDVNASWRWYCMPTY